MKKVVHYSRNLIALMLILILCVSAAVPAYAMETEETTQELTLQVIEASSEEELFNAFRELTSSENATRAAALYAGVARSSSTSKTCTLFLYWSGGSRYNGWRFKKVVISNGSELNNVKYGSIGDGSSYKTYDVDSASTGSVELGTVQIPTSVDRVKVEFTGLQGSLSANTSWISAITDSNWVNIK